MRTLLAIATLTALAACSSKGPTAPTASDSRGASIASAMATGDTVGAPIRAMALDFPPRDQSVRFRNQLEDYYRDVLHRPTSASFADIEGIMVWTQEYVRYRVGGCDHAEGLRRTLTAMSSAPPPLCSSQTTAFPTRPEADQFRNALDAQYRDVLQRPSWQSSVDFEGDGIWNIEYLRYRTTGCDHDTAYNNVKVQLDARGTIAAPAGCGGGTPTTPPVPPVTPPVTAPVTASFVMEQNGAATTVCTFSSSSAIVTNCRLNGSASTGGGTLSYAWTVTRFPSQGSSVTTSFSTAIVPLEFNCTVGAQKNTSDRLDVTLRVSNSNGQSVTGPRQLQLALAGCGA